MAVMSKSCLPRASIVPPDALLKHNRVKVEVGWDTVTGQLLIPDWLTWKCLEDHPKAFLNPAAFRKIGEGIDPRGPPLLPYPEILKPDFTSSRARCPFCHLVLNLDFLPLSGEPGVYDLDRSPWIHHIEYVHGIQVYGWGEKTQRGATKKDTRTHPPGFTILTFTPSYLISEEDVARTVPVDYEWAPDQDTD